MHRSILFLPLILLAAPAHATQGLYCQSKGASISMTIGHAAVPSLVGATLTVGDTEVPSAVARNWFDGERIMVDLADPDLMALIASLRLKWVKDEWKGTLEHGGKTLPVRCEEG